VSPILIRPVREQLEHDRLIRFLQQKYEKKFEVVVNAGDGQAGPVKLGGPAPFFPDVVLLTDGKIAGLIEVETGESTNNLEALAQWQHFGRARVPFHLYVPVAMVDAARRFCDAYKVSVTEMWTYRGLYEGFDLVRVFHDPHAVANTPKSTTVVPKLLPPVTPVHVEPEKEAKILELTNLVELANRTFRAAQGRTGTAAAARAAAKAAAKAAAAKPAAPVAAAKAAAATPAPSKPAKVEKPATPVKVATPKPASKPAPKPAPKPTPKTAITPAKAAQPARVAKPVPSKPAKAAKATPKASSKAVARSPKAKAQKASKAPAVKKAPKAQKTTRPKAPAASTKAKKTVRKR